MSQLQTLAPLLPELTLAIGAMLLLMYGVFKPDNDATGRGVGWLAILVMGLAGALVVLQPTGATTLFEGAFVGDGFARVMKLLVLAGSAAAILLAFDDFSDIRQMRFEYGVLILLSTTGMMVMISAGDLIALYLGLEMQSLAGYVLAGVICARLFPPKREVLEHSATHDPAWRAEVLAELAEQPGGLGTLADLPDAVVRELKELDLYDLFAQPAAQAAAPAAAADARRGAGKEALA